jgi:AGZA family xanthine/uracil permease-like MFS transporter
LILFFFFFFFQTHAPPCIKKSISVGLGLFQALLGFELMKLVVRGNDTLLMLGDLFDSHVLLALFGLMLIAIMLTLEVKGALLAGIILITVLSWIFNLSPSPHSLLASPSMQSLEGKQDIFPFMLLDFEEYIKKAYITIPVTFVMLFVAVFDTAGVQVRNIKTTTGELLYLE